MNFEWFSPCRQGGCVVGVFAGGPVCMLIYYLFIYANSSACAAPPIAAVPVTAVAAPFAAAPFMLHLLLANFSRSLPQCVLLLQLLLHTHSDRREGGYIALRVLFLLLQLLYAVIIVVVAVARCTRTVHFRFSFALVLSSLSTLCSIFVFRFLF